MSKKLIEVEVKCWDNPNLKVGDYLEYEGEIYKFDGYECGTYPFATHIDTGEQIELPSR
jgi:hypothetical protein